MLSTIIVSIVFGSIVALAALICGTVLIIVKTRDAARGSGGTDSEEAKIIQELYQGLDRMEARINALETILMDTGKKDGRNE